MQRKIFIFKTPQAYHWKLLNEIHPNPVRSKHSTIPPKVKKSKIFKKKMFFDRTHERIIIQKEVSKFNKTYNMNVCTAGFSTKPAKIKN